jgi:N-acetylmuramic acid 6-phosphate etherase
MIRLGKVYDNVMIDVRPTNAKLKARAIRIVSEVAKVTPRKAAQLLGEAKGSCKLAILLAHHPKSEAKARFRQGKPFGTAQKSMTGGRGCGGGEKRVEPGLV